MKVNKIRLKRSLREALNSIVPDTGEIPYIEQAEIEDALYECLCDWLIRSPNSMRQGGDYFADFTDAVAKKLGLADSETLKAALEDAMYR